MKALIFLSAVMISFGSFAADVAACKAEAHAAATEAYLSKYGDSMIFSQSKFKPMVEGNNIIHLVQIIDSDRGSNDIITVTLNKSNCRVLSID